MMELLVTCEEDGMDYYWGTSWRGFGGGGR